MTKDYSLYNPGHLIQDTFVAADHYQSKPGTKSQPTIGYLDDAFRSRGDAVPVRVNHSTEPAMTADQSVRTGSATPRQKVTGHISAWWSSLVTWVGDVRDEFRPLPEHYTLRGGVERSFFAKDTMKAGLLGLGLLVAVVFTFMHHAAAPTSPEPQTANGNPQTITLDSGSGGNGSNGSTKISGQNTPGTGATGTQPASGTNATSGNTTTQAAGSTGSGSIRQVGGYGGGSTDSVQPTGPVTITAPAPSPQPPVNVPGVTSPVPVNVPGTTITDGSNKQIVGTSPTTVTLN